jgi:hypothetical protein
MYPIRTCLWAALGLVYTRLIVVLFLGLDLCMAITCQLKLRPRGLVDNAS